MLLRIGKIRKMRLNLQMTFKYQMMANRQTAKCERGMTPFLLEIR